jgi:hypothetical protein
VKADNEADNSKKSRLDHEIHSFIVKICRIGSHEKPKGRTYHTCSRQRTKLSQISRRYFGLKKRRNMGLESITVEMNIKPEAVSRLTAEVFIA